MSFILLLLGVGVALIIPMIYAAYQKRYKRFALLFLLAWVAEQSAEALLAFTRHQFLLLWLYLFSCVCIPVAGYYWLRKANKNHSRLGH